MDIVIEGLRKTYEPKRGRRKKGESREALSGIDLNIPKGTFGLLGPNGAGKTTLMRILATLLSPTDGRILIDGEDLNQCSHKVREVLGYLPQDFHAFPNLKVKEFLHYSAVMRGMVNRKQRKEAVELVIESTGLSEVRSRRIRKLSGGMHRRVGVAQALLGPPGLLIIDEPTVGLDPEERIRLRNELARIGVDCTIILSTHIVGDISSSCEKLAVLDGGHIKFQGSPSELLAQATGQVWEFSIPEQELDSVKEKYQIMRTVASEGALEIRSIGEPPQRDGVKEATPILEDAYMLLMGDREAIETEESLSGDKT
ncbi:MAG: ATP-binding cassette domain-containing protein [Candidatus Hydrogenedentota bacterium]